jgi:hypothetical protein
MIKYFKLMAMILTLAVLGCTSEYTNPEPPDDEAMKWARYDKKTAEDAAYDYFIPKKIIDYLGEMDSVSQRANEETQPTKEDWPDQLLDIALKKKEFGNKRPKRDVARLELNDQEKFGRNAWMLWCGGNERFWDWLANNGFGITDLLKVIDSRSRSNRFRDAGLINEPKMLQAGAPDDLGLWLDVPADEVTRKWREAYVKTTFEQLQKHEHPSQRGSKGYRENRDPKGGTGYTDGGHDYNAKVPPPNIYGLSSGVIGLRLFPNPAFDDDARKKWDPVRFYNDESYYGNPKLIRPYRVGMSCAFCHASFHPLKPPRDVTQPGWENISGNIGAQYLRIRGVFGNLLKKESFVYHWLDSQPPGTIDTSLIASDNINNPNAMNAIFNLRQRVLLSFKNPFETLSPTGAAQPSLWGNPHEVLKDPASILRPPVNTTNDRVPKSYWDAFEGLGLLQQLKDSNGNPRPLPRILFDGADSIGAWGSLARVYLNIGTYSEQWERLHQPIIGFKPQQLFKIADCDHHSVYWLATKLRVPALRDYFLRVTPPMRLLDTPDGAERAMPIDEAKLRTQAKLEGKEFAKLRDEQRKRRIDVSKLQRGRRVFAENCIVCHSSIQPESAEGEARIIFQDGSNTEEAKRYEMNRKEIGKLRKEKLKEWANAGEFWDHDPGQWLHNDAYRCWAKMVVEKPKFWLDNYLSTDYRIPINLVRTNSGRAMATNALTGRMWEDFSSQSYRTMPSAGTIKFFNPYLGEDGAEDEYTPRHKSAPGVRPGGGGPGFYRVPTLISIWATAPLLHNNSLGMFNNDPSVNGRLDAFDDAIHKLLWPERRQESSSYNNATPERLKKDHGLIWRTPQDTYLTLSGPYVPSMIASRLSFLETSFSWLQQIKVPWLPSSVLLVIAFVLLAVESRPWQRRIGWATVLLGTGALCLYWARTVPQWMPVLDKVGPFWLPAAVLLLAGAILVMLEREKVLRYVGAGALLLGAAGVVLYVLENWFDWFAWLKGTVALWIPGALLLALGLLLFYVRDHKKLIRYLGYGNLILALAIGFSVYFVKGDLGEVRIGPIPKGTPVNLLINLNPEADQKELKKAFNVTLNALAEIGSKNLTEEKKQELFRTRVAPALMRVSKCPDFVMDQGHYYEWFKSMSDDDKEALVELLKTF